MVGCVFRGRDHIVKINYSFVLSHVYSLDIAKIILDIIVLIFLGGRVHLSRLVVFDEKHLPKEVSINAKRSLIETMRYIWSWSCEGVKEADGVKEAEGVMEDDDVMETEGEGNW